MFITKDKQCQGVEEIPIVCEFPEVFPEEILGLPLVREIHFTIGMQPRIELISKASYRTAPAELRELKVQL